MTVHLYPNQSQRDLSKCITDLSVEHVLKQIRRKKHFQEFRAANTTSFKNLLHSRNYSNNVIVPGPIMRFTWTLSGVNSL